MKALLLDVVVSEKVAAPDEMVVLELAENHGFYVRASPQEITLGIFTAKHALHVELSAFYIEFQNGFLRPFLPKGNYGQGTDGVLVLGSTFDGDQRESERQQYADEPMTRPVYP